MNPSCIRPAIWSRVARLDWLGTAARMAGQKVPGRLNQRRAGAAGRRGLALPSGVLSDSMPAGIH
jgi:hypothetical protein